MTIYTLIPPQAPLGASIRTNFRLSALLTLPLTALLYLLSGLTAAPLLPADFAVWVINRLAGVVRTGGFLLTSAAAVAINVQIDNALLAGGEAATVLLFVLSGGLVGLLSGWLRRTRRGWIGWLLAAGSGLLWGCALAAISRCFCELTYVTFTPDQPQFPAADPPSTCRPRLNLCHRLLGINRQHHQLWIGCCQTDNLRHLQPARTAPSGPEVEQHRLTTQIM